MKHHEHKKRRHDQVAHTPQTAAVNPQQLKKQHAETRRKLPVFKYKNEICRMVADNEVLLVVAETVRSSRLVDCSFFIENVSSTHLTFLSFHTIGQWQVDSDSCLSS